jgi:hypothetical protein
MLDREGIAVARERAEIPWIGLVLQRRPGPVEPVDRRCNPAERVAMPPLLDAQRSAPDRTGADRMRSQFYFFRASAREALTRSSGAFVQSLSGAPESTHAHGDMPRMACSVPVGRGGADHAAERGHEGAVVARAVERRAAGASAARTAAEAVQTEDGAGGSGRGS